MSNNPESVDDPSLAFLKYGGETARLIGAYDWSGSLGPVGAWPQSLKSTVGLMVHSPIPMVLLWGVDGIMLYNDAYAVFAGGRHPELLGSKVREGWPEVADFNDNVMRVGLAGGVLSYKDQELTLYRSGRGEPVWMNLDYSPVFDESGRPGGVIAVVVETTERVLAEKRQAALSARLRKQFDQAPGFVIIMTGPSHIVEFVNESHRRLFGSQDWTGRSIRTAFPSIEGQGFFEALDRVFQTGETLQYDAEEVRYQRGEGALETHYLTFIYAPIQDDTGRVTGIFCQGVDVTDSHRTLAALAESEARFRALFDAMDEGVMVIEQMPPRPDGLRDYRYLMTSQRSTAMFGMPDLTGSTIRQHFPDEDEFWYDMYDQVVATGEPVRFVHESTPQGMVLEMYLSRVGDAGSRRLMVVMQDITDRRRAELRLAQSEARFRFLDELSRATLASQDADEILAVTTRRVVQHMDISNCAYADMDEDGDGFTIRGDYAIHGSPSIVGRYRLSDFGRLAVETLSAGRPLILDDNAAQLPAHESATFKAMGIAATICMPLVKDGRLTALMAIHDKVPRAWAGNDLSLIREVAERSWAHVERIRAAADLRELAATLELRVDERTHQLLDAEAALRQAQKMEAVGQLTGGIAHDFNNLLTGVGGSLEMIERRLSEERPAETGRYIAAARQATDRAAALTQRLLAFSRRQTLDPKPLDANRLVDGMTELVQRSVGPNVAIRTDLGADVWITRVDPIQLESALLNLCINARDAMAPKGGTVTIITANAAVTGEVASELDLPPGDYVTVAVADTGAGMSPEVLTRVFEPFYTTKPLGQGTGLGLSMVYGFARQSGGQVRIVSEPGEGTRVSLYLPRHAGEAEWREGEAVQVGERGRGERVLIVDDEITVRHLIQEQLSERGYLTLEAGLASEALALLVGPTPVDLLITDVGLPGGMNGRQLADAARVTRPGLKVLFITGYAETAVAGAHGLDQDMGVLTKPFSLAQLGERVGELLKA